jgi:hypothetical protein
MDFVEVRYSDIGAPADNVSGTLGYWGSGTTANVTGLDPNTTYFFTIFTHVVDGGLSSTADNNPECQDDTDAITAPVVTTQSATSVEEETVTLNGNVTNTGGEDVSRGFRWGTTSGVYTDNWTDAGAHTVGAFTHGLAGLTKGDVVYYQASANNSAGYSWGVEQKFLTKPDPATAFTSTDNGTTWIFLNWVNGIGMDYVGIRYSSTGYPTDNTTGTAGYWGSGTTANVTGLNQFVVYYFKIFTYANEDGLWSLADGAVTCSDRTDIGTAIFAPTNFTLTDFGAITIGANWTMGIGSTYTIIVISRSVYPSSIADGELFYRGDAVAYNGTGYNLENTIYYASAWGIAADNTTFSTTYTTASIGGNNMIYLFLSLLALGLTIAMFTSKQMMLGFPCVIFWAILGGYAYTQASQFFPPIDWQGFLALGSLLGMVPFSALAAYALRTKKEELAEGDEYIDEGKDDVKFIDEGGKNSKRDPGADMDDDKPRRSSRNIRERAERRRARWD